MNKIYKMSMFLLFFCSMALCTSLAADESQSQQTLTGNFAYNDDYYLTLSNGSSFSVQKIIIKKASGWFDKDEMGNPAAGWLVGDTISIERTGDYHFPFRLINLVASQDLRAVSVDIDMKAYEDLSKQWQKITRCLEEIKKNVANVKEDTSSIKKDVANVKEDTSVIKKDVKTLK